MHTPPCECFQAILDGAGPPFFTPARRCRFPAELICFFPEASQLQWVRRLNNAVEYIESHLDSEIDIAQAARLAVCSSFHFQRVFSYMAGVTLTGYIRRRQMTLAAFEPAESGAQDQRRGAEIRLRISRRVQSRVSERPRRGPQRRAAAGHSADRISQAGLPSFNPWRSGTELQNLEKKMPSASSVFAQGSP